MCYVNLLPELIYSWDDTVCVHKRQMYPDAFNLAILFIVALFGNR